PTVNPFQPSSHGGGDTFIARITDQQVATPSPTVPPTDTPTGTHTRTATPTFSVVPTSTPTLCPLPFTDVQPANYFYEAVQYLYCRGVIGGYPDNTFRP